MRGRLLALAALAAAAGTLGWASPSPESTTGPVPLTIYRGGVTIDAATDPVVLELNKRLNIQIKFVTAPWGENAQKINLILSTGEPVDIVTTVGDIPKWSKEGAIIALDPYVKESTHPYVYKIINSQTFRPLKIEGKAYCIPQVPLGVAWGAYIRKDWLDKLGLKMPKDEEELYRVLKAFKEADPTGTTTGIQFEGAAQIRRTTMFIMSMFGVPSSFWDQFVNFEIKDGRLLPIATQPNTKAALQYMNRLYNEGLINHDFPSMNSFPMLTEKYMMTGKAGMGWVINPFTSQARRLKEIDPRSEVVLLEPLAAKGYAFKRNQGTMVQVNAVITSKSKVAQKAMDSLEYFQSWEGRQLLVAGVEGVHWKSFTRDGYFERIEENWERDYQKVMYHPLNFYLGQGNSEGYIPAKDYPTFEEAYANAVAFVPTSMRDQVNVKLEYKEGQKWFGDPNPVQFVQFPEHNDLKVAVDNAIWGGWTKCIAAKPGEFEKAWQENLAELKRVGLDRWVALYQDYYDKNIRK
jgi:ABC-type glycerol-3-phosphate transport system substrate-binding protein